MKWQSAKWWLLGIAIVLLGAGGGTAWYVQEGLRRASIMADVGLWADARRELDRYLILHPSDDRARMLYAETLIKDEQLAGSDAIDAALAHLRRIPDTARLGATARLQEGRIEFLLRQHPTRAEVLLRRALDIDPDYIDAYRVLWRLYDFTGRSQYAEPYFLEIYRREAWPDRTLRLREWFLSQFYPSSTDPSLDRRLGIVTGDEFPNASTEALRLARFRDAEPESPLCYASLALWFLTEGDPQFALEVLERGLDKMEGEDRDPYFLHAWITILLTLGDTERAAEAFEGWPEPHAGYGYSLCQAQLLQELHNDYAAAAQSYRKALEVWPGAVDWRSRNRLADCLARSGDADGAAQEREYIKELGVLMKGSELRRIREAMGYLNDRQRVREIIAFYDRLNRKLEADGWREHLAQLEAGHVITVETDRQTAR